MDDYDGIPWEPPATLPAISPAPQAEPTKLAPMNAQAVARIDQTVTDERRRQLIRVGLDRVRRDRALAVRPVTRQRRGLFLDAMRAGLTPSEAAALVGCHIGTLYHERRAQPVFLQQWIDALDAGTEHIEARLERIIYNDDSEPRDVIRAAAVLLPGRSARHAKHRPAATVTQTATIKRGEDGGGIVEFTSTMPGPGSG